MQETQSALIEGKVAKILNTRELVINRGSEHGIEAGMRFKVLEIIEEIFDPDTNENLGSISREKIRVKAVDVQPRFAIARTYETYFVHDTRAIPFALEAYIALDPLTKVRTIASDSEDSLSPYTPHTAYDERKGFVKIGDKVVQID